MKKNPNKTISVNSKGMIISFTDSNKHLFVKFDKPIYVNDNSLYQEFDEPMFSQKQRKMYFEAIYGIRMYPEYVIRKMPRKVVMKIITRSNLVQKAINLMKQETVNKQVDSLLTKMFPRSPIVKKMVNIGCDNNVTCPISAKDLKLSDLKIAEKLVTLKLLPVNFFSL